MGNILCVIRDPDKADNLIRYAARLAYDINSQLHLIYVQEEYTYLVGRPEKPGNYAGNEQSERITTARKRLSDRIDTAIGDFRNDVPVDFSTETTTLISAIEDYVVLNRSNLLILEAEEPQSIFDPGPSNIDIINEIKVPVLLVPVDAQYKSLNKIVYATAFREEDIHILKQLIGLTLGIKPAIRIVHISDDFEYGEKMSSISFADKVRKETAYGNVSIERLTRSTYEISDQILDYTARIDADLLVLLKADKNIFEKIFSIDHADKIARNPEVPVLIYKS